MRLLVSTSRRLGTAVAVLAIAVAACGESEEPAKPSGGPPPLDAALVELGRPLYEAHCAACHGIDGAGAGDWQTPRPDGSYPPPPHDSTGHTWHHPDRFLVELVAEGSDFEHSRMPAFGDRLTTREIVAILEYIKTWWGPQERAVQWEISQQDA